MHLNFPLKKRYKNANFVTILKIKTKVIHKRVKRCYGKSQAGLNGKNE